MWAYIEYNVAPEAQIKSGVISWLCLDIQRNLQRTIQTSEPPRNDTHDHPVQNR